MQWIRRILVTYMVATTMHLPFPVLDGDNLKSSETYSARAVSTDDDYDVDFILLGCDLPDDPDNGPVDDDPEDGSHSFFGPSYLVSKTNSQPLDAMTHHVRHAMTCEIVVNILKVHRSLLARVELRDLSFGKLCQSGTAHLRC